jgi:hypothetical protein
MSKNWSKKRPYDRFHARDQKSNVRSQRRRDSSVRCMPLFCDASKCSFEKCIRPRVTPRTDLDQFTTVTASFAGDNTRDWHTILGYGNRFTVRGPDERPSVPFGSFDCRPMRLRQAFGNRVRSDKATRMYRYPPTPRNVARLNAENQGTGFHRTLASLVSTGIGITGSSSAAISCRLQEQG